MAKQRTLDKAIGALYEVLAEGFDGYPEDEQRIRHVIEVLRSTKGR